MANREIGWKVIWKFHEKKLILQLNSGRDRKEDAEMVEW